MFAVLAGAQFYFTRSERVEHRLADDLDGVPCVVGHSENLQFGTLDPFAYESYDADVLVAPDCSDEDLREVVDIVARAFDGASGWDIETPQLRAPDLLTRLTDEPEPTARFSVRENLTTGQIESEFEYWLRLRHETDPFADVTLGYSYVDAEYDRFVDTRVDVDDSTTSHDVLTVMSSLSPPEAASTSWRLALTRPGGSPTMLTSDSEPPALTIDYALAVRPTPGASREAPPSIDYDAIFPSEDTDRVGARVVLTNSPTPDSEAWPSLLNLVRALDDIGRPFELNAARFPVQGGPATELVEVDSEKCRSFRPSNPSHDALNGFWLAPDRPRAEGARSWACL